MTIDQLKYFVAAAEHSHVGRAAVAVHISPSAISNAVTTLEEELDCLLFRREGKRIFLTDQGMLLRDRAQAILDSLSAIQIELSTSKAAMRGHFRLGASHFLSSRFLGKAWLNLTSKHAGVSAELCSMSTHLILSEVAAGHLDAGLCFSPLPHPSFVVKDLHEGSLKLCFRRQHPLARQKKHKAISGLSSYPAVIHKASSGVDICEFHPMFEKFGIAPKVELFFDNDEYALQRLLQTDSWSLLPDIVIQSEPRLVAMVPQTGWLAPYSLSFVVRRQRENNPVLSRLSEEIQVIMN